MGLRSFQQMRAFLAAGLARHAASNATTDQIRQLRELLEKSRRTIGAPCFERIDLAFYQALAVIPKNPILTAMHEALECWTREPRATPRRRLKAASRWRGCLPIG